MGDIKQDLTDYLQLSPLYKYILEIEEPGHLRTSYESLQVLLLSQRPLWPNRWLNGPTNLSTHNERRNNTTTVLEVVSHQTKNTQQSKVRIASNNSINEVTLYKIRVDWHQKTQLLSIISMEEQTQKYVQIPSIGLYNSVIAPETPPVIAKFQKYSFNQRSLIRHNFSTRGNPSPVNG